MRLMESFDDEKGWRGQFGTMKLQSTYISKAAKRGKCVRLASGEALSCSLFTEGSRQGHFFGFGFFIADFLAPI
jgi:hypothetical protein